MLIGTELKWEILRFERGLFVHIDYYSKITDNAHKIKKTTAWIFKENLKRSNKKTFYAHWKALLTVRHPAKQASVPKGGRQNPCAIKFICGQTAETSHQPSAWWRSTGQPIGRWIIYERLQPRDNHPVNLRHCCTAVCLTYLPPIRWPFTPFAPLGGMWDLNCTAYVYVYVCVYVCLCAPSFLECCRLHLTLPSHPKFTQRKPCWADSHR